MIELQYSACTNLTFDLKQLVKMQFTQEQIAKRMHMSRQQMQSILNHPQDLSINRVEKILALCGYKLQLTITKI